MGQTCQSAPAHANGSPKNQTHDGTIEEPEPGAPPLGQRLPLFDDRCLSHPSDACRRYWASTHRRSLLGAPHPAARHRRAIVRKRQKPGGTDTQNFAGLFRRRHSFGNCRCSRSAETFAVCQENQMHVFTFRGMSGDCPQRLAPSSGAQQREYSTDVVLRQKIVFRNILFLTQKLCNSCCWNTCTWALTADIFHGQSHLR